MAKENKKLTFLLEQATNQDFCSESDSLSSLTAVRELFGGNANRVCGRCGKRYCCSF